jgi:anti-sigma regulatory factor (Ser/Thr protein kinase)
LTNRYQLARAAELETLTAFRDLIDRACGEHATIGPQAAYDLKLAVEEACSNVTLTDFGHPFEPYEPGVPDVEADLKDGLSHGFGLYFIHQTMDQIAYQTAEDGNHLTFVKWLPAS